MKVKSDKTNFRQDPNFKAYIRVAKASGVQFPDMESAWEAYTSNSHPVLKKYKNRYERPVDPKPFGNSLLTGGK